MGWIASILLQLIPQILNWTVDRWRGKKGSTPNPSLKMTCRAEANLITNVKLDHLINVLGGVGGALETTMCQLRKFHAAGLILKAISTTLNLAMGQQAIEELKEMNVQLKKMADTMTAKSNFGEPFPQHVYRFVRSEIHRCRSENESNHYFFIYNPGTDWHPKFDELNDADPLPAGFCGYFDNLELLCGLLDHALRPALGPDAFFHILIPSNGPLVLKDPVIFPESIGKLHIKGELDTVNSGSPYVWMNVYRIAKDLTLDGVGNIPRPESWQETATVAAIFGTWALTGGSTLISTAALATVVGPFALLWFAGAGIGGMAATMAVADSVQDSKYWKVNPRLLGSSLSS